MSLVGSVRKRGLMILVRRPGGRHGTIPNVIRDVVPMMILTSILKERFLS